MRICVTGAQSILTFNWIEVENVKCLKLKLDDYLLIISSNFLILGLIYLFPIFVLELYTEYH